MYVYISMGEHCRRTLQKIFNSAIYLFCPVLGCAKHFWLTEGIAFSPWPSNSFCTALEYIA